MKRLGKPGAPIRPQAKPVHFALRADQDRTNNFLKFLHDVAKETDFRSITEILNFHGDECAVFKNDPHALLKIQARGLMFTDNRPVSYMPQKFSGFSMDLHNGSQFNIGLSVMPLVIDIPGIGKRKTGAGNEAQWISYVNTFVCNDGCPDDCPDRCVQSHKAVLHVLREGMGHGLFVHVSDPTEYWKTLDEKGSLSRIEPFCNSH